MSFPALFSRGDAIDPVFDLLARNSVKLWCRYCEVKGEVKTVNCKLIAVMNLQTVASNNGTITLKHCLAHSVHETAYVHSWDRLNEGKLIWANYPTVWCHWVELSLRLEDNCGCQRTIISPPEQCADFFNATPQQMKQSSACYEDRHNIDTK